MEVTTLISILQHLSCDARILAIRAGKKKTEVNRMK